MFKLPGIPEATADKHELADYVEWQAWQNGHFSIEDLKSELTRLGDDDYSAGVPENEVIFQEEGNIEVEQAIIEVYDELGIRAKACDGMYPFVLEYNSTVLSQKVSQNMEIWEIYKFLLLATRLNMKVNKKHAGIDGTLLFEELSAIVAEIFFGDKSESLVFGARPGDPNFEVKIENLCDKLGEGGGYGKKIPAQDPKTKDGKLDFAVCKYFSDMKAGKLIGFGQCKTGNHWDDEVTELQPENFCKKWFKESPAFTPIRMFFVSEALSLDYWYNYSVDAGLLFDRCRIIDFCSDSERKKSIGDEILHKIALWNEDAVASVLI